MPTVPDLLEAGAETYKNRNRVYGDSYRFFGPLLCAMWPDKFVNDQEACQFALQFMILVKMHRFKESPDGHHDSAYDAMVYAAMLAELTPKEGT